MTAIPFTNREMHRAWQVNLQASKYNSPSNAHRLLLFYSIECGLKAVLMKRQSIACTSHCKEIDETQHNINKLLDILSAGQALKLPSYLNMEPIDNKGRKQERKLTSGKVNQMWRYGGRVINAIDQSGKTASLTDQDLEMRLNEISRWIEGELK